MSFHQNFWLAASATAPVITLATVVVIPDAAGIRFRAARREWELRNRVASTHSVTAEDVSSAPGIDKEEAIEVRWAVGATTRKCGCATQT